MREMIFSIHFFNSFLNITGTRTYAIKGVLYLFKGFATENLNSSTENIGKRIP